MTLSDIRTFLREQPWAAEATVDNQGAPQAAVIGIAISDSLDILFDTLTTAHKHRNLCADSRIALAVGWDIGCTAQLAGNCDQPVDAELEHLKEIYFHRFPDGRERERLDHMTYWRMRPTAIRYSDFNTEPATIIEWNSTEIARWLSTP